KGEGLIPPLSPFDEIIITFYSDRNLNEKMEFKNPKVREYYENKEIKQEQIKTMQEAVKKASQKLKENAKNKEIEL
ncbi:hypothetical protein CUPS3785_09010, partial [Campylobacter upsaliensis]|nr:hypothetical protein [Campylobacter helveticus]MCR2100861.1 hypothetical protein [Campylobacter upsaliensis]MCR2120815.1 hypothetical protein [Campylobacter upsaliensis]MCR2123204.1 hypothetical protein [Campylobacter upsaliensis]